MSKAILILAAFIGVAVAGSYHRSGGYGSTASHGTWTQWGHWSTCSKKCGGGYQTRTRECTKSAYNSYGSGDCQGDATERRSCNDNHCVVNGGWGEWGYYGQCSATCGAGTKTRYRTCTNPAPSYGGADCYGSDSQSVDCNKGYCPVNGGWSEWGYYGECSATCGAGTKTRYRTCTNPAPAHGGAHCYGSDSQSVDCNKGYCSVNGGWGEWGYYGDCSATCGAGTKTRYRTCTNPAPSYGGSQCYGHDSQSTSCNKGYCPVNGGWSEWGYYGECSVTCGDGTKTRYRTCTNPAPSYGGSQCYGHDSQSTSCNKGYCPVDGGWTYWTHWSPCSGSCGTGRSYRSRSCTNPPPSYNGAQCTGSATQTKSCQLSNSCHYAQY